MTTTKKATTKKATTQKKRASIKQWLDKQDSDKLMKSLGFDPVYTALSGQLKVDPNMSYGILNHFQEVLDAAERMAEKYSQEARYQQKVLQKTHGKRDSLGVIRGTLPRKRAREIRASIKVVREIVSKLTAY
jgi:hypothetical protein